MTAAPEPPAEQEAGYAPPPASGAGSLAGPGTRGREPGPAGKVDELGAAGRKAWREAISAHNAAKARGRKYAKSQRPKPGMLRKPPPGEGT